MTLSASIFGVSSVPSELSRSTTRGSILLARATPHPQPPMRPAMSKSLDDLVVGDRIDEMGAIVALVRSKRTSGRSIAELVEHTGSAVELVRRGTEDLLFQVPDGTGEIVNAVTAREVDEARAWAKRWLEEGLDVRTVLDSSYPENLQEVFNRPPILFLKGQWRSELDWKSVSVVGTRSASELGLRRAARIAKELGEEGYTIVSGLALGIDTAAHTAALDSGARTVAVMGTGLEHVYPTENVALAERIVAADSAVVTQFVPPQPPTRWTFPLRNITMSGLALATVVVEASRTSGAKQQATRALEHGRPVFLMSSLLETHDWARDYVQDGRSGTRAIVIQRTADVVDRLEARFSIEEMVAS